MIPQDKNVEEGEKASLPNSDCYSGPFFCAAISIEMHSQPWRRGSQWHKLD